MIQLYNRVLYNKGKRERGRVKSINLEKVSKHQKVYIVYNTRSITLVYIFWDGLSFRYARTCAPLLFLYIHRVAALLYIYTSIHSLSLSLVYFPGSRWIVKVELRWIALIDSLGIYINCQRSIEFQFSRCLVIMLKCNIHTYIIKLIFLLRHHTLRTFS